jgi:hypothetical protein
LRLWIKARACLPPLLYEFAKIGQNKFAVLLDLFVGERAERIQEYSSGSFVGLVAWASVLCGSVLVIYSRGLWQRSFSQQTQPAFLWS